MNIKCIKKGINDRLKEKMDFSIFNEGLYEKIS